MPETIVSLGAKLSDLTSKMDKLVDLTTANNILLNTVVKRVETLETKVETNAGTLHDTEVQLITQNKRITHLENKLKQAMDVIDQLENRHRQNNLRLLNVQEKEESGMTMIDFLVKTFMEKWKLPLVADDFERAHRMGPVRDNQKHPRAIIFKLHHFQKKQRIINVCKTSPEDCDLRVVPDISVQRQARRSEFWPLRKQLHQLGLKTYFRHPAILWVEDGAQKMSFNSLDQAQEHLKLQYPSIN